MSEVLYPDGYATPPRMVPIETVFARPSVQMLHTEYQKRFRALMIAGEGRLGIGGAGRSSAQQERVFLERHNEVPTGGCCQWNGKRYQLKTGQAHAAPPGNSYHEDVVHGYAAAVDAIGDLKWAALHCEEYGLDQADWGGEVWHFQFTEFPHSVSAWRKQGSPQPQKWAPPPEPGDGDMTDEEHKALMRLHDAMFNDDAVMPGYPSIWTMTNQTRSAVITFWDGFPGNIKDGAGVLARTIKNTATKVGAKIG